MGTNERASFRYRVHWPAYYLSRMGHEVSVGKSENADVGVFGKDAPPDAQQKIAGRGVFYRKSVFDVCDNHFITEYADHYRHMCAMADKVTCSTETLKGVIRQETGCEAEVIPDPYEWSEKPPRRPTSGALPRVMWYGNLSSLNSLLQEIQKQSLDDMFLYAVCKPNEKLNCIPWSIEAMSEGFDTAEVVIIPVEDDEWSRHKSSNRMVEAIRNGVFVVANPIPAYEPFRNLMWLGDIREGVEWAYENAEEAQERVRVAQQLVKDLYDPEMIARKWESALTLDVAITS